MLTQQKELQYAAFALHSHIPMSYNTTMTFYILECPNEMRYATITFSAVTNSEGVRCAKALEIGHALKSPTGKHVLAGPCVMLAEAQHTPEEEQRVGTLDAFHSTSPAMLPTLSSASRRMLLS